MSYVGQRFKFLLLCSCGLLVSLRYQAPGALLAIFSFKTLNGEPEASSLTDGREDTERAPGSSELATTIIEDNEFPDRRKEQRTALAEDEFWLIETDEDIIASLPFDLTYEPPGEEWGKLEPLWNSSCTTQKRSKKLVFVNVVRSEAMAVQQLLSEYSSSCHAGFLSVALCSGLSWDSMLSPTGTWTNRMLKGGEDITPSDRKVHSKTLKTSVDILAGQVPLGCADKWLAVKQNVVDGIPVETLVDVQYIVSLRNPFSWFVSNTVVNLKRTAQEQQQSTPTVASIIEAIRDKVQTNLANKMYHEIYARYLITPSQIAWIHKIKAKVDMNMRLNLSLANLKSNNALIVISEQLEESLEMVQSLLGDNLDQSRLTALLASESNTALDTTTSSVIAEVNKDTDLSKNLEEYLKYELMIYKEAKLMHNRQLKWVQKRK